MLPLALLVSLGFVVELGFFFGGRLVVVIKLTVVNGNPSYEGQRVIISQLHE